MTAAGATRTETRTHARSARRVLPGIALGLALLGTVLLAAGPLGWRAGWWYYTVALAVFLPAAGLCASAAVATGAIAVIAACNASKRRRSPLSAGIAAVVIGAGVAYMPLQYLATGSAGVSINDITTDPDNPPVFVAAASARRGTRANSTEYRGAAVAAQQQHAYPDIAPAMLDIAPGAAFARALNTAQRLGWTITDSDAETGRIEALQRSRWFGFTDDVVIRVTPSGGGSRVDIRSASRYGRGDFGVNAKRIRSFLAALRSTG